MAPRKMRDARTYLQGDVSTAASTESVRAYEAEMAAQGRARLWHRMTMGGGLVLGAAYAFYDSVTAAAATERYDAEEVGLQAAGASALLSILASFIAARSIHDLVLAAAEPNADHRSRRRMLVGGALVFGAIVGALILAYFSWFYARFNASAYEWNQQHVARGETLAAAIAGTTLFYFMVRSFQRGNAVNRLLLAGGAAATALAALSFGLGLVIEGLSILPLAVGAVGSALAFVAIRPSTDERLDELQEAAAKEVGDELRIMRRAVRRNQLAFVAGILTGGAVAAVGWSGIDLLYEHINRDASHYDRIDPGLGHVILLLVAACLAGLLVTRRLQGRQKEEEAPLGDAGGIFDETLATTSSLEVHQQITLASLLLGSASRAGYQLIDGGGAFCGAARERGNALARLLIGGRRSIHIEIDDLGRNALTIRRRFWPGLLFNHAHITEGDREVGRVRQRWSLRRRYRLVSAAGEPRYELVSGWLRRSRFRIERNGEPVGELRRLRRPWYIRMFTPSWREPDRFAMRFPADAQLEDRRLMMGALFLVDITHYPTHAWLRLGPLFAAAAIALLSFAPNSTPASHDAPPELYELDEDEVEEVNPMTEDENPQ